MNNVGKKNKKTISVLIVAIIVAVMSAIIFTSCAKPSKISYINYKDDISMLKLTDVHGKQYELNNTSYKFMIFLSESCGTCLDSLPILKRVNEIICKDQNIDVMLLWEDDIPQKEVNKYGLEGNCYSLNNVRISSTLDTIFFVDSKNEVLFVDSGGDYDNFISYIEENLVLDRNIMKENANSYVTENLSDSNNFPQLIYMSMPGCPDCIEADAVVMGSEEIANKFVVTRIEREKDAQDGDIIDYNGILKFAYEIDWFPSFIIAREDKSYDIVRKIDIDVLKEIILSCAN